MCRNPNNAISKCIIFSLDKEGRAPIEKRDDKSINNSSKKFFFFILWHTKCGLLTIQCLFVCWTHALTLEMVYYFLMLQVANKVIVYVYYNEI
jgi:hypothetical protein